MRVFPSVSFLCFTKFPLITGLILGGTLSLSAQNVQLYGAIPSFIANGQLTNHWSYNLALSSDINAINREYPGRTIPAEVLNINLEGVIANDVNPNVNLALGFQYRSRRPFSNGLTRELRPWQQITLIHYVNALRIRNRLRLEQRFTQRQAKSDEYDVDLRLRYRLSVDFPLQGERLDDKEFYLNLSNESLFTLTAKGVFPFWENRNYAGLGYQINRRNRIEPALDFRTRRTNDAGDRQSILFLRIQWIYKIPTP